MTNPIRLKNPSVAELKRSIEDLLKATQYARANTAVLGLQRRMDRLEKLDAAEEEPETDLIWPSMSEHLEEEE